jgi:type II secretory pathway pseudopilin PulG
MILRARAGRNHAAFTLIEVLLTSVLAATLLAALWALLSMYLKLFDAGQAKVEQSQLIRTLFAQLETDLASVVQSPPPVPIVPVLIAAVPSGASAPASGGNPASGNASSSGTGAGRSPSGIGPAIPQMAAKFARGGDPSAAANSRGFSPSGGSTSPSGSESADPNGSRFPSRAKPSQGVTSTSSLRPGGVFGTETSLRIDVVQSAIVPAAVQFDEQRAPGDLGPSRVPELMTIIYAFEETHAPGQPLGESTMLLVRRERAWEDSHPAKRGARGADSQGSSDIADRRGVASGMIDELSAVDPLTHGVESETTATVPEVAQFGIRYFNGVIWSTEWNSIERKALPVAIEIALELKHVNEQGHQPATEPAASDVVARPPVMPIHRLLVHLPGGQAASPSDVNNQRGPQSLLRNAEPPWKGNAYGSPR